MANPEPGAAPAKESRNLGIVEEMRELVMAEAE
jgi:hypothetical protein